MAITRRSVLLVVCMLGVVLYRPAPLSSCGPFFARVAFTYTVHPIFLSNSLPLVPWVSSSRRTLAPTSLSLTAISWGRVLMKLSKRRSPPYGVSAWYLLSNGIPRHGRKSGLKHAARSQG